MLRGRKAVRSIDARSTFALDSFAVLAIKSLCTVSQTLSQRAHSLEATVVRPYY